MIFLLLFPLHAQAGFCERLLRVYEKAEAVEENIANARKVVSALWVKPEELQSFDPAFFAEELERLRILHSPKLLSPEDFGLWDPPRPEEPPYDETPPAPGKAHLSPTLDLKSYRFETKLAYLELAISNASNGERSLAGSFSSLPEYRKAAVIEAVNELYSGKPLTPLAIEHLVGDLYIDTLKWHYPKLFRGPMAEQTESVLKSTLEARLVSRNVSNTLRSAGLLNEAPSVFKRIFQGFLKGQAVDAFVNLQINGALIRAAMNSSLVPYWIIPPSIRFNRWIEIPEEMLLLAEERGLLPAWNDTIRPYLIQRYGSRVRTDLIYTRLQRFWSRATTYAFVSWLGFTLTWTAPTKIKTKVTPVEAHQLIGPQEQTKLRSP